MLLIRSFVLLTCGLAAIPALVGCDDADVGGKKVPPSTAPAKSSPSTNEPKAAGTADDDSSSKTGEAISGTKKVALPELPDGAGEIDADAPEEFTKTESGLKYRILRNADG